MSRVNAKLAAMMRGVSSRRRMASVGSLPDLHQALLRDQGVAFLPTHVRDLRRPEGNRSPTFVPAMAGFDSRGQPAIAVAVESRKGEAEPLAGWVTIQALGDTHLQPWRSTATGGVMVPDLLAGDLDAYSEPARRGLALLAQAETLPGARPGYFVTLRSP